MQIRGRTQYNILLCKEWYTNLQYFVMQLMQMMSNLCEWGETQYECSFAMHFVQMRGGTKFTCYATFANDIQLVQMRSTIFII